MSPALPPVDTVEGWALQWLQSTSAAEKLAPGPVPVVWAERPAHWAPMAPGRSAEWRQRTGRKKPVKDGSLTNPAKRAELIHTFLHHELQAAELMAWAILAFPQTPEAFRRGLLSICLDELRHLQLYAAHLTTLGFPFGSFPINDWFWKRVPMEPISPAHFVARLGIGFEGGNLDHGLRFAEAFAAAGDEVAARIQRQIVDEEISHAAFALHWFGNFVGEVTFEVWRSHLPGPVTPRMTCGVPMHEEARRRAGYSPEFLQRLHQWNRD